MQHHFRSAAATVEYVEIDWASHGSQNLLNNRRWLSDEESRSNSVEWGWSSRYPSFANVHGVSELFPMDEVVRWIPTVRRWVSRFRAFSTMAAADTELVFQISSHCVQRSKWTGLVSDSGDPLNTMKPLICIYTKSRFSERRKSKLLLVAIIFCKINLDEKRVGCQGWPDWTVGHFGFRVTHFRDMRLWKVSIKKKLLGRNKTERKRWSYTHGFTIQACNTNVVDVHETKSIATLSINYILSQEPARYDKGHRNG